MAVGAKDYIDQLLVKKYAQQQVDNHSTVESMVNPEKMMEAMTDYAAMSRNMLALNRKLVSACSAVNARGARYSKGATFAS